MKSFFEKLRAFEGPLGASADGRPIGLGLATALRKARSADGVESHVSRWATEPVKAEQR
ncbi:hypothetical protein [Herbidospora cretacea]|uniref:hypothetical protein n=1 Tax=Herbidospora cretacea TaxID=28444 RepID=UPI000AF7F2C6|nr:hypothetical protein [Herbidospora cretacea]